MSDAEFDALFQDGERHRPVEFACDVRATGELGLEEADRVRLKRKYGSSEFKDYAFHILTFREHDEERDMLIDLARVEEIFTRWNVSLKIDPLALGVASPAYATTPD